MLKRFLKMSLALCMVFIMSITMAAAATAPDVSPGAPAKSGDNAKAEEQLKAVTKIVKQTLSIDDTYTSFSGNYYENAGQMLFNLNWEKEDEYLSVTANGDGLIMQYNRNVSRDYGTYSPYNQLPKFKSDGQAEAVKLAEAFTKMVLRANESFKANASSDTIGYYRLRDYGSGYVSGSLCVNGVETEVGINLSVDTENGIVTSFNRGDISLNVQGGMPSAKPQKTKAQAGDALKGALALELIYVLDGANAVLRYVPKGADHSYYYVDANTGKLINRGDIYNQLREENGATSDAPMAAGAADNAGLTEVELEGIKQYENVKSVEELEKIVRAYAEFKLDGYSINSSSYHAITDEERVICTLTLTKKVTAKEMGVEKDELYDPYIYKTFTLNAETGELLNLYSNYPYHKGYEKDESQKYEGAAKSFLEKYYPELFKATKVRALEQYQPYNYGYNYYYYDGAVESYQYTRVNDGVYMPDNGLYVSVSKFDGSIASFNKVWAEDVKFEAKSGLIGDARALDSYFKTFDVALKYLSIPTEEAPGSGGLPVHEIYPGGTGYRYQYVLGYVLTRGDYVYAIDAKTGEALKNDYTYTRSLSYDDIADSTAKAQIEALAEFGVGFTGGSFNPQKGLTQKDMLILLLSALGSNYDDNEEQEASIYSSAYSYGLLKRAEKAPQKSLSLSEALKLVLRATPYDEAAQIGGIYKLDFKDAASIPQGYEGYVAIAEGLKMIQADKEGNIGASAPLTRQDAAVILYNYMAN